MSYDGRSMNRAERVFELNRLYNERRFDDLLDRCDDDIASYLPETVGAAANWKFAALGKSAYCEQVRAVRDLYGVVTFTEVAVCGSETIAVFRDEAGNEGVFSIGLSDVGRLRRVYCFTPAVSRPAAAATIPRGMTN